MKAIRVHSFKQMLGAGRIEGVVWHVPEPVPPSEHRYKYRLVYVVAGTRVLGFDNERGKGDHRHVGAAEVPYVFLGVDQLIDDLSGELTPQTTVLVKGSRFMRMERVADAISVPAEKN